MSIFPGKALALSIFLQSNSPVAQRRSTPLNLRMHEIEKWVLSWRKTFVEQQNGNFGAFSLEVLDFMYFWAIKLLRSSAPHEVDYPLTRRVLGSPGVAPSKSVSAVGVLRVCIVESSSRAMSHVLQSRAYCYPILHFEKKNDYNTLMQSNLDVPPPQIHLSSKYIAQWNNGRQTCDELGIIHN